MDLRKLKTLIDLVSESNISELEITEADGKVRIVKADPMAVAAPAMAVPMATAPMMVPRAEAAAPVAPAATPIEETGHVVKSPMVGTFYRAASPGGKPLAEVGMQVTAGQAVCIIEAMKIMNEIESDVGGVIEEVCVANETPVEYGTVLFRVRPG
jgi:acetyl-CoA carboxylase biotin carboxyl carrier protein